MRGQRVGHCERINKCIVLCAFHKDEVGADRRLSSSNRHIDSRPPSQVPQSKALAVLFLAMSAPCPAKPPKPPHLALSGGLSENTLVDAILSPSLMMDSLRSLRGGPAQEEAGYTRCHRPLTSALCIRPANLPKKVTTNCFQRGLGVVIIPAA